LFCSRSRRLIARCEACAAPTMDGALLAALRSAASGHDGERKAAEAQLAANETAPGYYSTLLQIVGLRDQVDLQTRQIAALLFKNGLDKYWRKSAK